MTTPLSPLQGGHSNRGRGRGGGAEQAQTHATIAALTHLRLVTLKQHCVGCVAPLPVGVATLVQTSAPSGVLFTVPLLQDKPTLPFPVLQKIWLQKAQRFRGNLLLNEILNLLQTFSKQACKSLISIMEA